MNKLVSTTLVSACLAAGAASVAVAQTTPGSNAPPTSAHAQRFAQRPFVRPTERVEARLAYLKTALKITDAQQSQWNAFADFVRRNAQDREQRFKSRQAGEREQHRNAIERLERAQSFQAAAVTRLNQLLEVARPLYAVLSPEQQKVADALLNRRFRAMAGAERHGRGGWGRG